MVSTAWDKTTGAWPDDDPEACEASQSGSPLKFSFPGHTYKKANFRTLVAALRKHEPSEFWMRGGGSEWNVKVGYSKAYGKLDCLYFEEIQEIPANGGEVKTHNWVCLHLSRGVFRTARGGESRTLPEPFDRLPQGACPADR